MGDTEETAGLAYGATCIPNGHLVGGIAKPKSINQHPPWAGRIGNTIARYEIYLEVVEKLVVNSDGDQEDTNIGDDVCDVDTEAEGSQCTLRAAIQWANATTSQKVIGFEIPSEGVPEILLQSPLPVVKAQVLIDGTTQQAGKVIIDGTSAGSGVNGLTISSSGAVIKGLIIRNFKGDGLRFENSVGDAAVVATEVLDNDGWGVYAKGDLHINETGGLIASSLTTRAINNGREGSGGGLWSYNGRISGSNLEVTGNGGPGILALGNISLLSVQSANNKGPGIQSFAGAVRIGYLPEVGLANQVSGNRGYGILAHQDAEQQACAEGDCQGVIVESTIEVTANAAAGIYAQGDIVINEAYGLTVSGQVSKINNNGNGLECWVIEGRDLALQQVNCQSQMDLAGIWSYDGRVSGRNLEVTGNGGPGILALGNISLLSVWSNNNKGPGIQSFAGAVRIGYLPEVGLANQVLGNLGYGIHAHQDVEQEACAEGDCQGVIVESAIEVTANAAAGIYAQGDIVINEAYGLTVSGQVSIIQNNGNGTECWVIEGRDRALQQVNCQSQMDLSGVRSYGGGVSARYLEVFGNGGPGVEAAKDLWIMLGKINGNKEEGLVSGGVVFLQQVEIRGNLLDGIRIFPSSDSPSGAGPLNVRMPLPSMNQSSITGCLIVANGRDGIRFEGEESLIVTRSHIFGNTGFQLNNLSGLSVEARDNWWGNAQDPGSTINGAVDFSNWREEPFSLMVVPDPDIVGGEATDVTAGFYISNLSESDDTYTVAVSDTLGWSLEPASLEIAVAAGATQRVSVAVSNPFDAQDGLSDEITCTAVSKTSLSVTDSARLTVMDRSPGYAEGPGHALHFDGLDDHVDIGTGAAFESRHVTVEAWIKSGPTDHWHHLVAKRSCCDDANDFQWSLQTDFNTGRYTFVVKVNNQTHWTQGEGTEISTEWTHLAGTYDGETLKLYVNGVLRSQNTDPSGDIDSLPAVPVVIGARADGVYPFTGRRDSFLGEMDEVRIWNTALAESVIREWMHKPLTGAHPFVTVDNGNNLVGYWKFNEGSGFAARDYADDVSGAAGHDGGLFGTNDSSWRTSGAMCPFAFEASEVRPASFSANWDAVIGATGYFLDVAIDSGFTSFVPGYDNTEAGPSTSFQVTSLEPDTPYFYRVRAMVNTRISPPSKTIRVTTPLPDKGNVNGDKWVDLVDAIIVLKLLSGKSIEVGSVQLTADVNGDGLIGLAEVLYILQVLAGSRAQ